MDYYVDDGSFCSVLSPFAPASCSPQSNHNANAISSGNKVSHPPTTTIASGGQSVTSTALAAVSSLRLAPTYDSVNACAGSHIRHSCTMNPKDLVSSGFLYLFGKSVALASVTRIFVLAIDLVLCIALHTVDFMAKGRLRSREIYELVMVLQSFQSPPLQNTSALLPPSEASALVEDDDASHITGAAGKDAISNSPSFSIANDIIDIGQGQTDYVRIFYHSR